MARTSKNQRTQGLRAIALALRAQASTILAANEEDMEAARRDGLSAAMLDRLHLDAARVSALADAVEAIADLDDPIGAVVSETTRPNGLSVQRVRIPLGVIAMIYEARPNVTTDAAALCLRTGNAVILRGGKEAFRSNLALAAAVQAGLVAAELPRAAVQVMMTTDRGALLALLQREGEIDLVIPRGGEGLIRFVSEHSRIPVLRHYKGVCHVYVHASADLEMARAIVENAKVQRPGVCNAAETLLVDEAVAPAFLPGMCARFAELGVEIRGDERTRELSPVAVVPAQPSDWDAEYLDKIIAIRVVRDMDEAIGHIERHGSNHTEAIVAQTPEIKDRFLSVVNSSTVVVNASTRFADGGELGLGAEIGISTTKLHAYGPMGAEGLTATKFVVRGDGQVRT